MSAWTKFATNFFHEKQKKNPDYKFSQALKEASKVYKKTKGGSSKKRGGAIDPTKPKLDGTLCTEADEGNPECLIEEEKQDENLEQVQPVVQPVVEPVVQQENEDEIYSALKTDESASSTGGRKSQKKSKKAGKKSQKKQKKAKKAGSKKSKK